MTTKDVWAYISISITVSDNEQHWYSNVPKGIGKQDFTIPLVAKDAIDYTKIIQAVVNIAVEDFYNPKEETDE